MVAGTRDALPHGMDDMALPLHHKPAMRRILNYPNTGFLLGCTLFLLVPTAFGRNPKVARDLDGVDRNATVCRPPFCFICNTLAEVGSSVSWEWNSMVPLPLAFLSAK